MTSGNPLAPVKMNECEGFTRNFLYEGHLRTFIMKDLGKKLGMSFDDFISRPRYEIELMLQVVDDLDKKKNAVNETLLQDLADGANAGKLK